VVINLSEAAWNNEAAEPEQPETPETPVENSDRIVIEEFEITFAGAELTLDDEGNEAILIGLGFTNNGSETVSFQSDLMYEAYQGETELDDCTVYTGEDSSTTYDDSMYVDVAPGETHLVCMTYALSDLTTPVVLELSNIMEDETGTVTIDLSEASLETSEEGEFSPEFAALYAGDWHGMAEFTQCSGKFEELNGQQVEIIARFVFDDNGNCTPYIRLCLSQDESENLQNLSVAYDAEYDCMFLYGDLYNLEIGGDYTFVMFNENRALNICADNIEDLDNGLYFSSCLRRLDETWDYNLDYPYLPEDGVAFYSGMSMEEIVELYGYDTALLPQAEGGSGAETPAAPPETPAEVGIVDLQVLIDFKNWLDEVNTYENDYYKPTFEECLEKMGCEGIKVREDEWTDTQQKYRWETADGRDNISMVIRTDDEGVWRWHSISWTGGVNG